MKHFVIVLLLLLAAPAVAEEWRTRDTVAGPLSMPVSLAEGEVGYYGVPDVHDPVFEEFFGGGDLAFTVYRAVANADAPARLDGSQWENATYAFDRPGVSVRSGFYGDDVFYIKCRTGPLRCIEFHYPAAQKPRFDAVVTRIANSFQR